MKLGLFAAPIQWRKKTKSKSNQVMSGRPGEAKKVLVENNLSTSSFPFRFLANGAYVIWFSLGLPEVTLISGRFVIFKMNFSKIQL